jgi:hypothetical protein
MRSRYRLAQRNENRLGRARLRRQAGSRAVRFGCRGSRLPPRLRRFGKLLQPRISPSCRPRSFPRFVVRGRVLTKRTGRRIVDDEARKDPSLGSGWSRIGEGLLRLPRFEYGVRGALGVPVERRPDRRGLEQSPVRG